MIEVFTNPFLLDFVKVCINLPADEREQLEEFTGHPYDVDGAAVGNYSVPGPKWVLKVGGEPLAVGGFVPERPGVWRDFMLTTPTLWEKHWFEATRVCRRVMDAMLLSGQAHRLECITPLSRERVFRWYTILRYKQEAVMPMYTVSGKDAVLFARTI